MALLPNINYPTQIIAGPITINDNQVTPSVLFSLAIGTSPNIIVEYSIIRGTVSEIGRIMVSTNGANISLSNDNTGTNLTGVLLSPAISGPNLEVQYISSHISQSGRFWYSVRNIKN
jgi:hypothetical protein